ncbi:MAG: cobalamin-independent methionine synthase II family protein [Gammaproteobacteria bacterium]
MDIPTEPIGSIPRPRELLAAWEGHTAGVVSSAALETAYARALEDTIRRFEDTGSPVISDGEQRKFHNFATYAVEGLPNLAPDGFALKFTNHVRRWPRLTKGPFHYRRYAYEFLDDARRLTCRPLKQAVISPSAVSLLYPAEELPGYTRKAFVADLLDEHEHEVRGCLERGAHSVQVDFTEGRLACKLDPSGELLNSFIHLNNLALNRLSPDERRRVGVHTCPGGDRDSTHSADVDYADLLPSLFQLNAGMFYVALAREPDRGRVLALISRELKPHQRVFVGVVDPLDPRIDTPEEVCGRVLEAASYIPLSQLGTTDDCGYAPFCDDTSTSRETAFAKIAARVAGTRLASQRIAQGDVKDAAYRSDYAR